MGTLGQAYIDIVGDVSRTGQGIERDLGGSLDRAGRSGGGRFNRSLDSTMGAARRATGQGIERDLGGSLDRAGHEGGGKFSKSFSAALGAGGGLAGALGIGFGLEKAVGFFVDATKAASDLSETGNKIDVLFGSANNTVQSFAKGAATNLGQSRQEALDAAAAFGIYGQQAGLSGEDLAGFSTKLVGLSTDLASFSNASPQEAVEAIGAAFKGEGEQLENFGIIINASTIANEALRLGLIKTTSTALTPQQNVLAVQSLLYAQTSNAQGDFARTSSGLANQQRILAARFKDARLEVGEKLLPVALALATALAGGVGPAISLVADGTGALVNAIASSVSFLGDHRTALLVVAAVIASAYVPALLAAVAAQAALVKSKIVGYILSIGDAAYAAVTSLTAMKVATAAATLGITLIAAAAIKSFFNTRQAASDARDAIAKIGDAPIDTSSFTDVETRINDLKTAVSGYAEKLKDQGGLNNMVAFAAAAKEAGTQIADLRAKQEVYNGTIDALGRGLDLSRTAVIQLATAAGAVDLLKAGNYNEAANAITKYQSGAQRAGSSVGDLAKATATYADAAATAEERTKAFNTALEILIGDGLSAEEAASNLEAAFDAVTASVKDNGHNLNLNSEAGRSNREALRGVVSALAEQLTESEKAGAGSKALSAEFDRGLEKFKSTAREAGFTEGQIAGLVKQYGLVPKTKDTLISQRGADSVGSKVEGLVGKLDKIPGRVTVNVVVNGLQTLAGLQTKLASLDRSEGVSIPKHANGAILNRATLFLGGEAGREVVVPLTRPKRARELADASGLTALLGGGADQEELALLRQQVSLLGSLLKATQVAPERYAAAAARELEGATTGSLLRRRGEGGRR